MSEVPLVYRDGKWHFSCQPNSELICGKYFSQKLGYCVALAFKSGGRANYMTPEYAHKIAEQLFRAGDDDDGLRRLAMTMDIVADRMEFQNAIWERLGRPADGVDSITAGHA